MIDSSPAACRVRTSSALEGIPPSVALIATSAPEMAKWGSSRGLQWVRLGHAPYGRPAPHGTGRS